MISEEILIGNKPYFKGTERKCSSKDFKKCMNHESEKFMLEDHVKSLVQSYEKSDEVIGWGYKTVEVLFKDPYDNREEVYYPDIQLIVKTKDKTRQKLEEKLGFTFEDPYVHFEESKTKEKTDSLNFEEIWIDLEPYDITSVTPLFFDELETLSKKEQKMYNEDMMKLNFFLAAYIAAKERAQELGSKFLLKYPDKFVEVNSIVDKVN